MMTKIALIGNPNCGKTTMFNDLTGSIQRVGNWPGVTVDKKEGKLKINKDVTVVDLPGIYSLSPYTPEEVVSRDFLVKESPDVIINIVDATNLERNLYLTMQVLDIGIPTVIALNMIDVVEKRGDQIDIEGLKKCLGCEVIATSALKKRGSTEVAAMAVELAAKGRSPPKVTLSQRFESSVYDIESILRGDVDDKALRWYAVKLIERDSEVIKEIGDDAWNVVEPIINQLEKDKDDDGESIVTNERYDYIVKVVRKNQKKSDKEYISTSDKIDRIVTNRWLALPIFAAIMIFVYYISISTVGTLLTDWLNESIEGFGEGIRTFLEDANVADWLTSLVVDGMIAGVGAVLGFLPQMLVLFTLLVILEDCGYMARIAFIMDRVFRRFGLSGKSFIPALIGTGCAVPGIMAARTIESESDRKITVMTTSFMPCSAKLPVIALIVAALFVGTWWVAPLAYFLGVASLLISGIILKKFRKFVGKPSPFIMELPAYHAPGVSTVARQTGERGWAFVKKAGTIILLASMIIWFLSSFNWGLEMVDVDESMLKDMGSVIAGVFVPLGFGQWELATATLSGLVAKENIVATIAILFGVSEETLPEVLAQRMTEIAALSFLVFNLLCAPCIAAMGAMYRELGSFKGMAFAVVYQCLFAYAVAMIVYQFGRIFYGLGVDIWIVGAVAAIGIIIYLMVRPEDKPRPEAGPA